MEEKKKEKEVEAKVVAELAQLDAELVVLTDDRRTPPQEARLRAATRRRRCRRRGRRRRRRGEGGRRQQWRVPDWLSWWYAGHAVFPSLWTFFYGPLYLAVCSVLLPEGCVRGCFWETTSGWFPYSSLVGSTVDTCLQFSEALGFFLLFDAALVVDYGGMAGFAGSNAPRAVLALHAVFYSFVGRPKIFALWFIWTGSFAPARGDTTCCCFLRLPR